MARPTIKTPELLTTICNLIADGQSLRRICQSETMPDRTTVRQWLIDDAEFSIQYARAREEQADTLAEEIVEIADESSLDYTVDDDGNHVLDREHVQRSKLRVDARKWVAAKLRPKVYGDKLDVNNNVTGTLSIESLYQEICQDGTHGLPSVPQD